LWVNVDENGNITGAYGGLPDCIQDPVGEVFDYYFEVSDEVFKNIGGYQVINGELVKKD
jgi:hypothetical protein